MCTDVFAFSTLFILPKERKEARFLDWNRASFAAEYKCFTRGVN